MLDMDSLGALNERITIFSFNHHSNRNIIAQKGVFTYVSRDSLAEKPLITDLINNISGANPEIPLKKYVIDYQYTTEVMDYLFKHRKTANAFFPGYDGVVRCMKDYANYEAVLRYEESSGSKQVPDVNST